MTTLRQVAFVLLAILSLLAPITAICAVSAASAPPTPAVYETGHGIPASLKWFTAVMEWDNEKGARMLFKCFRTVHPTIDAALYQIPVSVRGGRFQGNRPYTIVVASYGSEDEARRAQITIASKIDYDAIKRCLKISPWKDKPSAAFQASTSFVFDLTVPNEGGPLAMERSPIQPLDAISAVRGLPAQKGQIDDRWALIARDGFDNPARAGQAIYALRSQYPDVHFAAIEAGGAYYLTAAAFTTEEAARDTTRALRKRGLYDLSYRGQFTDAGEHASPTPWPHVSLKDVIDMDVGATFVAESSPSSEASPVVIVEGEILLEPLAARITRCLTSTRKATGGITGSSQGPRIDGRSQIEFASCSGILLSKEGLVRCVAQSECHGVSVPVGFRLKASEVLTQCITQTAASAPDPSFPDGVNVCLGVALDEYTRSALADADVAACISQASASQCTAEGAYSMLCKKPLYKDSCLKVNEFKARFTATWMLVMQCATANVCAKIVPRPSDLLQHLQEAVNAGDLDVAAGDLEGIAGEAAQLDPKFFMGPMDKAFGFMDKIDDAPTAISNCLTSVTDGDDAAKNKAKSDCLAGLAAHSNEVAIAQCVNGASGQDAVLDCFAKQPELTKLVQDSKCARDAIEHPKSDSSIAALVDCAGDSIAPGEREKLGAVYTCTTSVQGAIDAIAQCGAALGVDTHLVKAANCLAKVQKTDGETDYADALSCVGNLPVGGSVGQIAQCIQVAQDDGDKMRCLPILSANPQVTAVLGCLQQSNGDDTAMGACVVSRYLPPQLARAAACYGKSTGETSFAICAAGIKMNAELRTAAECAVETGGTPPAFAICTAGRLTLMELQKCLSGQIGASGGCFGPNNTLRLALETVFKIAADALGPDSTFSTSLRSLDSGFNRMTGGLLSHFGGGKIGECVARPFTCATAPWQL